MVPVLPGYSLAISDRTSDVPGTVLKLPAKKQTYPGLKRSQDGKVPYVTTLSVGSSNSLELHKDVRK
jgi:hypothetical protein